MMKTIMLVPVFMAEDRLLNWKLDIERLNPLPDKIVFVTNNNYDSTLYVLNSWRIKSDVDIISVWFKDEPIEDDVAKNCYVPMAHVRELLLAYARNHREYDYAIFMDTDVHPLNNDFIERITSWGKDVVGGAYMRRFPQGVCAAAYFWGAVGYSVLKKVVEPKLTNVKAVGGGCMCLSRRIIDDRRVSFYPLVEGEGVYAEDFGYCLKAGRHGYSVWLDSTEDIFHEDSGNRDKPWMVNMDGSSRKWSYKRYAISQGYDA